MVKSSAKLRSEHNLAPSFGLSIDASINYVLPQIPFDTSTGSPFQGFAPGTIESARFIPKILSLPNSCLELLSDREQLILCRSIGLLRYQIVPLHSDILGTLPFNPNLPFWCFLSTEQTIEASKTVVAAVDQPILHFTSTGHDEVPHVNSLDTDTIHEYSLAALRHSFEEEPTKEKERLIESLTNLTMALETETLPLTQWGHNATLPNICTLVSAGYELGETKPLHAHENEAYSNAISESAATVREIRDKVFEANQHTPFGLGPTTGFIVAAPTVYRHLYGRADRWASITKQLGKQRSEFVRDFLVRRKTFSMQVEEADFPSIIESAEVQQCIHMRQKELDTYTHGISVVAASDFAPAIRLSPGIEQFQSSLRDIAGCARGNSPHRAWKMNKLTRNLTAGLLDEIGPRTIAELEENWGNAKIITDIPLEWLPIGGLPLAVRNSASRIPTTPGNLLFGECMSRKNRWIDANELREILVVRSFSEQDPLRNVLKSAVIRYSEKRNLNCRVKFVDVDSLDELVQALNSFSGAMMIFDGHGSSSGDSDIAGLVIGNEVVDCWKLRGIAQVPPIVLLSACDTHPVDGSHASSANGFIAAGATTVLATFLPIHAGTAALHICRLLLRISDYLPLYLEQRGAIRWIDFIGGFQRMTYISELLDVMLAKRRLDERSTRDQIQLQANLLINSGDPQWHERTIDELTSRGGIDVAELTAFISEWYQLSESMIYAQIGNPESLLVHAPS